MSHSLPRDASIDALRESLAICMEIMLRYVASLDERYGVTREAALSVVLGGHLDIRLSR